MDVVKVRLQTQNQLAKVGWGLSVPAYAALRDVALFMLYYRLATVSGQRDERL